MINETRQFQCDVCDASFADKSKVSGVFMDGQGEPHIAHQEWADLHICFPCISNPRHKAILKEKRDALKN